jgi:hypothetical protein
MLTQSLCSRIPSRSCRLCGTPVSSSGFRSAVQCVECCRFRARAAGVASGLQVVRDPSILLRLREIQLPQMLMIGMDALSQHPLVIDLGYRNTQFPVFST